MGDARRARRVDERAVRAGRRVRPTLPPRGRRGGALPCAGRRRPLPRRARGARGARPAGRPRARRARGTAATGTVDAVSLAFVGARPGIEPVGEAPTGAKISIFRGPREAWLRGLPVYGRLVYRDVWPGIDIVYQGALSEVKHSFIVHPGADPAAIRLAWRGAKGARVDAAGRLVVDTAAGPLQDEAPIAWQEDAGADGGDYSGGGDGDGIRTPVAARYDLRAAGGGPEYGFALGAYDPSRTLIIDPAMFVYAGIVGGAGYDRGLGIAVDGAGSAYLSGNLDRAAFVAKFAPDGRSLVYMSMIDGSGYEGAFDVDVDAAGAAYVTGPTSTTDGSFPAYRGPALTYGGGATDDFVAKVAPDGTDLLYAGFLGGVGEDFGEGIVVDGAGNAYVHGLTESTDVSFPVKIGPDLTQNGQWDAFVTKVKAEPFAPDPLDNLAWSGFIGGAGQDVAILPQALSSGHIGVDREGNAYISGQTTSREDSFPDGDGFGDLPTFDATFGGYWDAYVAKVRADGTGLAYASYIGGLNYEEGKGMAIDDAGAAYMTGETYSDERTFPVKTGPDLTYNGGGDAFLAKIAPDGRSLAYLGYLGGDDEDSGQGVHLGPEGTLYVTGNVESGESTFPVTVGPDLSFNGPEGMPDDASEYDAFIGRLRPDVGAPADPRDNWDFLGYIGGDQADTGWWVDVDARGDAYVSGGTYSGAGTFPDGDGIGALPSIGEVGHGDRDAYIAKIAWRLRSARTVYLPWTGRATTKGESAPPAPIVPTASNTPRPLATTTPETTATPTRRPGKPVELPPGEALVFSDDFSDPGITWTYEGRPGAGMGRDEERMVVATDKPDEIALAFAPVRFDDGAIEVTIQREADDGSIVGVYFGPKSGGFYFMLTDDASYALVQEYGDSVRTVLAPRSSPALLPGTGAHRLRIERMGGHVTFFVDGVRLTDVDRPYLAERGPFALLAIADSSAPTTARFDDVVVTRFTADRPMPLATPTTGPTAAPTGAPTVPAGQVIYQDDFGDPASGWLVANDELHRMGYAGGQYEIAVHAANYFSSAEAPDVSCGDCTVEVTTRFASAAFGAAGIIVLENGRRAAIACGLLSDGRYVIERITGSGDATIVDPTASDAIKKGAGAVNKLKVVRSGTDLFLYANGVKLTSATVPGLALPGNAGVVAIAAEPEFVARFDDFKMTSGTAAGLLRADGPAGLGAVGTHLGWR
ncbi:MAG: hypothetical protein U0470_12960 [Anaerolineae bacterium]